MSPYLIAPNVQNVKIELKIPKPIMDFLQAAEQFADIDPKKHLERIILDGVLAEVDNLDASNFWNSQTISRKYGITQIHYVTKIYESSEKGSE